MGVIYTSLSPVLQDHNVLTAALSDIYAEERGGRTERLSRESLRLSRSCTTRRHCECRELRLKTPRCISISISRMKQVPGRSDQNMVIAGAAVVYSCLFPTFLDLRTDRPVLLIRLFMG